MVKNSSIGVGTVVSYVFFKRHFSQGLFGLFFVWLPFIVFGQNETEQTKARISVWYGQYFQKQSDAAFGTFMDSTSAAVNAFLARKEYGVVGDLYQHGFELAKTNQDTKSQLRFLVLLGNFFRIRGDFQKSNEVLLSAPDLVGLAPDKAQQYLHIASNYLQINPTKTKFYLDLAQSVMPAVTDTATLMLYHFELGSYYRLNNDMSNAIQQEIAAMRYMDRFPIQKVGSLIKLSDYMVALNHLQPAFDYLDEAAQYYNADEDKRTHAFVLLAKSKVFYKQKNYQAAIDATNTAYNYLKTTKLVNQQAKCLYFLATYTAGAGDLDAYKKIIEELKVCVEKLEDNNFKETALLQIAKYELNNGNIEGGKRYFNQIKVNRQLNDFTGKDDYLALKARIQAANGEKDLAIQTLETLLAYKDSLELNNTNSVVAYQESQYNRQSKDREIERLNRVSIEKSTQIRRVAIITIVLGLFLLLALWFYRSLKTKNRQIFQQNEQMRTLLHDKDFLMKEIHHRVKNNLQVVSSLLNLQSNYIKDPVAFDAINEGKNRVSSMALIHKNLYSDDNLTAIETVRYFDDLIDQIFDSYNIDQDRIIIEKDIDSMLLDVDTMVPLGLVTNELVSNALKHAFTESNGGIIQFSLKDRGNTVEIKIRDNGKGLQKEAFTSSESFGNKMIAAFVHKLKAQLSIIDNQGTEITLIIAQNNNYAVAGNTIIGQAHSTTMQQ